MIQVTDLHAEYVRGAVTFVATSRPRLTWRTLTTTPNWTQASAELRVTRSDGHSENHRVSGADSVLVSWPFTPLAVRERVTAAVRVIGADGAISGWATPITLEAASLDPGSWHADLVAHPDPEENLRPVQFIREVRGELRKVAWPTRPEVVNYSIIVLIAVVLLTAYVALLDYGVGDVLLKLFER